MTLGGSATVDGGAGPSSSACRAAAGQRTAACRGRRDEPVARARVAPRVSSGRRRERRRHRSRSSRSGSPRCRSSGRTRSFRAPERRADSEQPSLRWGRRSSRAARLSPTRSACGHGWPGPLWPSRARAPSTEPRPSGRFPVRWPGSAGRSGSAASSSAGGSSGASRSCGPSGASEVVALSGNRERAVEDLVKLGAALAGSLAA